MDRASVKVFGREPAFWVGVIEALLGILLSWHVLGLGVEQIGGIMAVVVALSGVYVAYVTRDTMLGVLVGFAKAVIICMAAFQVHLTEAQITSVIALVTILGGAFNRTQTEVALRPSFRDPTLPTEAVPVPVDPVTTRNEVGAGEARLVGLVVLGVLIALIVWAVLNAAV